MIRLSQLNTQLTFFERANAGDDGRGNARREFVERFAEWADMRLRPGSEVFSAARLEGRVPYSVKVRRNPNTQTITTGWLARDSEGREYNVQAPAPDPQDRSAIHMLLVMNMGSV